MKLQSKGPKRKNLQQTVPFWRRTAQKTWNQKCADQIFLALSDRNWIEIPAFKVLLLMLKRTQV